MIYETVNTMKTKKLSLGIVGGGPNSWIGHVHRISARFDDRYEIVAGVFSRNSKLSISFGGRKLLKRGVVLCFRAVLCCF